MNARHQKYRLHVELRQVKDAASCFLHSLLLHRTVGKFTYSDESNYKLGSIGICEVDCDSIDLAYVRVNSDELCAHIDEQVCAFYSDLEESIRTNTLGSPPNSPATPPRFGGGLPACTASIGVEFFQKRRRQWRFSSEECVSWEVWNLVLEVVRASNDELSVMRESVAEEVSDAVLAICSRINRQQFMPKMPTRSELSNVFETRFSDSQPYLFKIDRTTPLSRAPPQRAFSTIQSVIRNTLALP